MRIFLICLIAIFGLTMPAEAKSKKQAGIAAESREKREFRGAWIQTAFQDRFMRLTPEQAQQNMTQLVDQLASAGINAILFQVRPEGDAFYVSSKEPWSRFLTGQQGVAPIPLWDPMAYMIRLCHERHIEFHAWINPYRMTASRNQSLPSPHLYYQHPEWFVRYDDKLYLNPGMPECRSYVRDIVKDIVQRYDIDAFHIDDYFYPYPIPGRVFDDRATFAAYAPQMGFDANSQQDWDNFRRRSVNILIKGMHDDIRAIKPWVRFGVSPFGIYRNQKSWPEGSLTNGTQCYDDLYADVLLWAEQGWVDYLIPQLYWEIGHKQADYATLVEWWSEHTPQHCQLYIGQSIDRSLDVAHTDKRRESADLRSAHTQFAQKLALAAQQEQVKGNCYWYAYQVGDNSYHVADWLKSSVHNGQPVLLPRYTHIDAVAPQPVVQVRSVQAFDGMHISWRSVFTTDVMQEHRSYVVYRFQKGETISTADGTHMVARTTEPEYVETEILAPGKYIYVVTALDACFNESRPAKCTVKIK